MPENGVADTAFANTNVCESDCFETDKGVLVKYNGEISDTVVIPLGVTEIGDEAFKNNVKIRTLIIGNEITVISGRAFYGCENLEKVIFGSGVINIKEQAFAFCSELSEVDFTLSENISEIAYDAFDTTHWLKNYVDDCVVIHKLFYKYQGELQDLHIINSVTKINDRAFYGNTSLDTVHFPESLQSIGKEAFAYSEVSKFDFSTRSDEITEIEDYAFAYCENLTFFDIRTLSSLRTIGKGAFRGIKTYSPTALLNIYIPASVEEIGEYAFEGSGVFSVKIENGSKLEIIEYMVFANCGSLESVIFEGKSNLYDIKDSAFLNCVNLRVFNCAQGKLETIGEKAFYFNVKLSKFEINDENLIFVGQDAFAENKFITDDDDTMIFVGTVLVKYNGILNETVIIPAKATAIGNGAFKNNLYLKNIVFTLHDGVSNVKEIQDEAFSGCTGITVLNLPAGLTLIGNKAFAGCASLTQINFGKGKTFPFTCLNWRGIIVAA